MSPRKIRLVADAIRGMDVDEAEVRLEHIAKRAADPLKKLLRSAVANALHNFQKDHAALFIQSLTVDKGPMLKRYRARAFGRAADIHKHTSHVTLILGERAVVSKKRFTRTAPTKAAKAKEVSTLEEMSAEREQATSDLSTRRAKREETHGLKKTVTDMGRRFFRRKSV